ncbi:hypothetical protein MBANPS3_005632, partial [Mucor bainieri]
MSSNSYLEYYLLAARDINNSLCHHIDCIVERVIVYCRTFKTQFLLELHLMEAIEHEFFADEENIECIKPIWSLEDQQSHFNSNTNGSIFNTTSSNDSAASDHANNNETTELVQRLLMLRLAPCHADEEEQKENDEEEDDEEEENEKKCEEEEEKEGESEVASLADLMSKLRFTKDLPGAFPEKDVKEDIQEMAALLSKLCLRDGCLDAFDRELAVFDSNGNIAVEETSAFAFLEKALVDENSEERQLLTNLFFPEH